MDYTARILKSERVEHATGSVGGRTASENFDELSCPINIRLRRSHRFGLTERDDATGLDHTWFRKNEGRAGRFASRCDPSMLKPAKRRR